MSVLQKAGNEKQGRWKYVVKAWRPRPPRCGGDSTPDCLIDAPVDLHVNAQGGCNDCHTHPSYAPGGDPFLGEPKQINAAQYLAGGRQFGPFTSRNLTPDPTTGLPADLTFEQFLEVMRKGTDFDLKHPQISPLLQVMPWPVFGDMTNRDLRAIYEYLRAIPSLLDNPNPGP